MCSLPCSYEKSGWFWSKDLGVRVINTLMSCSNSSHLPSCFWKVWQLFSLGVDSKYFEPILWPWVSVDAVLVAERQPLTRPKKNKVSVFQQVFVYRAIWSFLWLRLLTSYRERWLKNTRKELESPRNHISKTTPTVKTVYLKTVQEESLCVVGSLLP